MALADTAELVTRLKLDDQFSGPINRAKGSLGSFGVSAASASKHAMNFGGAINHAGGRLKELLTGPLGIIGLTGGLFSLGTLFESSVRHASDLGFAVEKLTGLTGESATSMSELLVTFEKFGISAEKTAQIVGFAEKTLGKLSDSAAPATHGVVSLSKAQEELAKATEKLKLSRLKLIEVEGKKKASSSQLLAAEQHVADATRAVSKANYDVAFALKAPASGINKLVALQDKFNVQLTDTKGNALAFGTILGNVADFYNSNAAASDKAYLASILLGRGYAQLIPILKLGSQGIKDAEAEAKSLGLTLTAQNAVDLKNYRSAIRNVGEALGGLQLQIGLALLPEVQKLAVGLTGFLEHGGTAQISAWFKEAAKFAEQLGGVLEHQVIPTLQGLAAAASSAWSQIPPEFRDLITKGIVADRTIKFALGFSPIKVAVDFAETALAKIGGLIGGKVAEKLADKAFAQPVLVVNWPPGLGGIGGSESVIPLGPGGTGGRSLLSKVGTAVLGVTVLGIAYQVGVDLGTAFAGALPSWLKGPGGLGKSESQTRIENARNAMNGADVRTKDDLVRAILGPVPVGFPLDRGGRERGRADFGRGKAIDDHLNSRQLALAAALDRNTRAIHAFRLHLNVKDIIRGITERSAAKFGHGGLGPVAVDATFQRNLLRQASGIAGSTNRPIEQKLAQLVSIQAALKAHGDTKAAAAIGRKIDQAKAAQVQALNAKKLAVTVSVGATTVNVNARGIAMVSAQINRYGGHVGVR